MPASDLAGLESDFRLPEGPAFLPLSSRSLAGDDTGYGILGERDADQAPAAEHLRGPGGEVLRPIGDESRPPTEPRQVGRVDGNHVQEEERLPVHLRRGASVLDVDQGAVVQVQVEGGPRQQLARRAAFADGPGLAQQPPEQVRHVARHVLAPHPRADRPEWCARRVHTGTSRIPRSPRQLRHRSGRPRTEHEHQPPEGGTAGDPAAPDDRTAAPRDGAGAEPAQQQQRRLRRAHLEVVRVPVVVHG